MHDVFGCPASVFRTRSAVHFDVSAAVTLVAGVAAIVVSVAAPQGGHADAVVAPEVAGRALPVGAVLLVAAVPAFGLSVAHPALREAARPVPALEPSRAAQKGPC